GFDGGEGAQDAALFACVRKYAVDPGFGGAGFLGGGVAAGVPVVFEGDGAQGGELRGIQILGRRAERDGPGPHYVDVVRFKTLIGRAFAGEVDVNGSRVGGFAAIRDLAFAARILPTPRCFAGRFRAGWSVDTPIRRLLA